jgi:antitoxin component YwqK of YwqJK toxin-antitoxin module
MSFIRQKIYWLAKCLEGGQSAREPTAERKFRGTRQCQQKKDRRGIYVNVGRYYEWHDNDKIALKGAYNDGRKTGRWLEYDPQGVILSDRYYENGVEVPAP